MKVLFLDCFSGISGDMTVGALVDLGVKPSALEWELTKLDLGDFHMHFDRQKRQQVEGVKFGIHEGATHTHDQDEEHCEHCEGHHHHEHDHGHAHAHEHEHEHGHEHGHEHHHHGEGEKHEHDHDCDHDHGHEHKHAHAHTHEHHEHEHGHEHDHHHEHGQEHDHDHGCEVHGHEHHHHHHHGEHTHGRTHKEIRELIEHSELSAFVKKHALSIFQRIAVAEGKIHGQPVEDVHFHEVGALDSIADIICACVGIETVGVDKVFISTLHDGSGTVKCAHGIFPLPAPATMEILKGIPFGQIDEPHELITPTGAAIAAEFGAAFGPMPQLKIEKIGYGVGSRDLESRPNVLRAVLGTLVEE